MPKCIKLLPWEINLILKALAELPYNRVAATIQSIKDQVDRGDKCNLEDCDLCPFPCEQHEK